MKKYVLKDESERLGVSDEKNKEYVNKLSKMINLKTVWTQKDENKGDFDKFYFLVLSPLWGRVNPTRQLRLGIYTKMMIM